MPSGRCSTHFLLAFISTESTGKFAVRTNEFDRARKVLGYNIYRARPHYVKLAAMTTEAIVPASNASASA
jgi:hypothetical protein